MPMRFYKTSKPYLGCLTVLFYLGTSPMTMAMDKETQSQSIPQGQTDITSSVSILSYNGINGQLLTTKDLDKQKGKISIDEKTGILIINSQYYQTLVDEIIKLAQDTPEKQHHINESNLFSFFLHDTRGFFKKMPNLNWFTKGVKGYIKPSDPNSHKSLLYVKREDGLLYPAVILKGKDGQWITKPEYKDYVHFLKEQLVNLNRYSDTDKKLGVSEGYEGNKIAYRLFHDICQQLTLKSSNDLKEGETRGLIALTSSTEKNLNLFFYHHVIIDSSQDLKKSIQENGAFIQEKIGEFLQNHPSQEKISLTIFTSYYKEQTGKEGTLNLLPYEIVADAQDKTLTLLLPKARAHPHPDFLEEFKKIYAEELTSLTQQKNSSFSGFTYKEQAFDLDIQEEDNTSTLVNEPYSNIAYLYALANLVQGSSVFQTSSSDDKFSVPSDVNHLPSFVKNIAETYMYPQRLVSDLPPHFTFPKELWEYPRVEEGIFKIIKSVIGHVPEETKRETGENYNGFERGSILIKGLTQDQAQFLFKNLQLYSYERKSTHGFMFHGIDLDQKFWISTPVETFRHLLYSCPRIQGENSEPFSEDQALLKDFNQAREKIFIKELQDPQNKDKLFYMHIKPESFGMRGVTSTIGHAFSYVQTRIDKGYKKRKSYYGEKSGFSKDSSGKLKESGNGSFVMTIPQKGK